MDAREDRIVDPARQAWAHAVFGLAPDATPQEVHGTLLAQLEEANFMPSPAWRQAIRELAGRIDQSGEASSDADAFRDAQEGDCREAIERFASVFFDISIDERRKLWSKLLESAGAFPRQRLRLLALQPGLEIDPKLAIPANPEQAQLIERLCRLFVLRPGAQGAQRRAWIDDVEGDWRPVVRRVRSLHPTIARLDVHYLLGLEAVREPGEIGSVATAVESTNRNLAAAIMRTRPLAARSSPLVVRTHRSPFRVAVFVLLGVFVGLFFSLAKQINRASTGTQVPTRPPIIYVPTQELDGHRERAKTTRNGEETDRDALYGVRNWADKNAPKNPVPKTPQPWPGSTSVPALPDESRFGIPLTPSIHVGGRYDSALPTNSLPPASGNHL